MSNQELSQKKNEKPKRLPINGTFELTGRCNLNCKMCLVRVDHKRIQELGYRERTAEEWIDMAKQAADAGTLGLLLTGGEVMLRPDFCDIYEAIAKMGFLVTVYTNATMVTDQVMNVFQKYPPHKIGVTMYGASNDTYAKLCGCSDGYDRFIEGVQKLSSLPSLLETRTTIVKDNWHDLKSMQDFTKNRFGEDKILQISRFVTKSIRGGIACVDECRLTPEENIELVNSGITSFYKKVKSGEITLLKPENQLNMHKINEVDLKQPFLKKCEAGYHQYTISWDGRMYACELMPEGCTKPFEIGFLKAWEELPEKYPNNQIIKTCLECRYAYFCEVCPAIRCAETGDFFGIPQYFCNEAKYLYKILSDLDILNDLNWRRLR